ncbi:hypothetical protein GWI33_019706 [Rhynchophorus ferrugineus]|uniref:Uncharacterized protein n=1 Tax=Rhynchophorus ferrugineus TaxID=354439 RepID=A0A834HT81_RHYFE|nr:hypothetical protein GWI33_019706 [Rhynchophorus ferrugineus]
MHNKIKDNRPHIKKPARTHIKERRPPCDVGPGERTASMKASPAAITPRTHAAPGRHRHRPTGGLRRKGSYPNRWQIRVQIELIVQRSAEQISIHLEHHFTVGEAKGTKTSGGSAEPPASRWTRVEKVGRRPEMDDDVGSGGIEASAGGRS